MSSVNRRKDKEGREYGPLVAYWRDENKKLKSKTLTTKSLKEARKIAAAKEAECESRRELGIKGEITVQDAYERYERSLRSKKIRGKPVSARHIQLTRAKYQRLTGTVWNMETKEHEPGEVFIKPTQYISQISKRQWNDFVSATTEDGLGSDLRYKTQLILKAILEIAEDNDFAMPRKRIIFKKMDHDEYIPPTVEPNEWNDLYIQLRGSKQPCNAILLLWLLNTGARISEALSARVDDVRAFENRVYLRRKKGNPDTWWTITDEFADTLAEYLQRPEVKEQTYLFESPRKPGRMRSHCQNWYRFGTIECGINHPDKVKSRGRVRVHTTRHYFITQMTTNGMDISAASKLIGHKNVITTAGYDGSKGEAFQPKMIEILNRSFAKRLETIDLQNN